MHTIMIWKHFDQFHYFFTVFSVVSKFSWLLIARSLHGVASSCISVCGMGMVARMYEENEEERSKFMGHILGGIAT